MGHLQVSFMQMVINASNALKNAHTMYSSIYSVNLSTLDLKANQLGL